MTGTVYDPAATTVYRHPGVDTFPLPTGYARRIPVQPVARPVTAR